MILPTRAQLESAARGSVNDMRVFFGGMLDAVTSQAAAIGQTPSVPSLPSLSATGANGTCTVTIAPATTQAPTSTVYEVSYSASATFSSGVTTLPLSASTSATVPAPGQTLYFRIRASVDQKTWTRYQSVGPIVAGLQTSAATSPNMPLNQSNYAKVDSLVQGGAVTVRVYGAAGGPGTSWVSSSGKVFPSASLVGEPASTDVVVAFDPTAGVYRVRQRLADAFPDSWVPVGSCSIVGTAPPSLPTVVPIEQNGAILGYNVTDGGNGITAPLTLTVVGAGTGATAGQQTIQGGKLVSVAPGNAGQGYSNSTTVTASGGQSAGVAGGGGVSGGNGGRLVN